MRKTTTVRYAGIVLGLSVVLTGALSLRHARAGAQRQFNANGRIIVQEAGRGAAWLKLRDGIELAPAFNGQVALDASKLRPQALAAADFDEDGVPDLISGFGQLEGGLVTLQRGNVDALYPHSPEAQQRRAAGQFTDAPFLAPARVFVTPVAPELLGAGDFDADGHGDLVVAARGDNTLHLLPGDGQGGFAAATRIALPGAATAMVTGEINAADGLTDLIVAVNNAEGAKALVFEHPNGALKGNPEAFDLPAQATVLALGQLDADFALDLAVAAENELIIVHGRDRQLALAAAMRTVAPAQLERRAFACTLVALAIGDFSGDEINDLALLTADGSLHLLEQEDATESMPREQHRLEATPQFIITAPAIRQPSELGVSQKAAAPSFRATSRAHNALLKHRSSSGTIRWHESRATPILPGLALSHSSAHPLLVATRSSSLPTQDLVLVDQASRQLRILNQWPEKHISATDHRPLTTDHRSVSLVAASEPVAVLPLRLNSDALSDLVILQSGHAAPSVVLSAPQAIFTVMNTNDGGPGSLRQALTDANNSAGADEIRFNIPGNGPHTLKPLTQLPFVTQAVTIDGTTQQGFAGKPFIELDGSQAGIEVDGLSK